MAASETPDQRENVPALVMERAPVQGAELGVEAGQPRHQTVAGAGSDRRADERQHEAGEDPAPGAAGPPHHQQE